MKKHVGLGIVTVGFTVACCANLGFAAISSKTSASQTFAIDPAKSNVEFLAIANPGSLKIRGKVKSDEKESIVGNLTVKDLNVTGSAKVKLDSLVTGIDLRDKHMKEKHLQVQNFPDTLLTFVKLSLPEALKSAKGSAENIPFEATLSLHGKTNPVKGICVAKRDGDLLNLNLEFKVAMTQYGIEQPSFMGITVANDVDITAQVSVPAKTL